MTPTIRRIAIILAFCFIAFFLLSAAVAISHADHCCPLEINCVTYYQLKQLFGQVLVASGIALVMFTAFFSTYYLHARYIMAEDSLLILVNAKIRMNN